MNCILLNKGSKLTHVQDPGFIIVKVIDFINSNLGRYIMVTKFSWMRVRQIGIIGGVILMLITVGCGSKTGESAVSETHAQIDSAHNAGREAARKIINRKEWRDSMEFHGAILEATAIKSRYKINGQNQCEAAFDSAFISTIRSTRPDLASRLQ